MNTAACELWVCIVHLRSSLGAAVDSTGLQNPQLSQLEANMDEQSAQLATILSSEVQLQEALRSLGKAADARLLAGIQEQQATLGLKKRNVLKRLEELEQKKQEKTGITTNH